MVADWPPARRPHGTPPASRAIAHVDMDAFYAAIEQRDRPELRGRPVIVGASPTGRGVVSAASYEARKFGVRSAMPIGRAARLCPEGHFLPVDMEKYQRVSVQIMGILADFSPLVEPVSVDEAFVDLTGTESLFGSPLDAVRRIKRRITAETSLTASAGLAANKFVAKVASDLEKPDGLVVVAAGDEARFLGALPIERLWGVGKVMAKELRELGFTSIGQLQKAPRAVLAERFGKHGAALYDLAFGRDDRAVEPFGVPKSIGAEETFGADCTDPQKLRTTLRAHAERVAAELRDGGYAAGRVTVKLRLAPFETHTRSVTGEPTQDGLELYRRALALLERDPMTRPVRLIGLSASRLGPAGAGQLDLLDPAALRRERLARVVDKLTARFGEGTVVPATLLGRRHRHD
ncbi:MAG TPA: DNA polymerase IV [Methylomirabilota bacterium]|nr:DNA polymerase IV [Methylomirabilota bacterium]